MAAKSKKIDITQIVLLKHIAKRWRSLTLRRSNSGGSCGGGGGGCGSVRPPPGNLAVYVGPDRRRFVIPARFMNFPVFASLLEMAEEELGFQPAGGLVITCDVDFFTWAIKALQKDEERFKGIGLDGFLDMFSGSGSGSGLCKGFGLVPGRDSFSPLISKTRV